MAKNENGPGGLTAQQKVDAFGALAQGVALPEGLRLDTDEEMTLWSQLTRVRLAEDWRTVDLIWLHRIVKLEVRLRECWEIFDDNGPVVQSRGALIMNPVLAAINALHRQQMQIMGRMSLMQIYQDNAQATNERGRNMERQTEVPRESALMDLLASPEVEDAQVIE